jgi:hypothetical protein
MTDEDACQLIFESGFFTAKKRSDVSGRGVGMDVVMVLSPADILNNRNMGAHH